MNGYRDYHDEPLPHGAKVSFSHEFRTPWYLNHKTSSTEGRKNSAVGSTEDRIIDIVVNKLGVEKSKIKKDSCLDNDLSADSLDQIEIILKIENEFDIYMPDGECENIKTIDDLVKLVEYKLSVK